MLCGGTLTLDELSQGDGQTYITMISDKVGALPPPPPNGAGESCNIVATGQREQVEEFGRLTPADGAKQFVAEQQPAILCAADRAQ